MNGLASTRWKSEQAHGHWLGLIDQAILAAETAELELSRQGGSDPSQQRKASGSYYTPADVAGHFWDLFFRHHRICDLNSLLTFISSTELVEPSAGSGMFVFSFLKKAALLGATPESLANLRFHVVDINLAALRFFSENLREIERALGVGFDGIGPDQSDFLEWVNTSAFTNVVFVGNPPFVANPRGARWRNLYADFVEAMLSYRGIKGVSLIVPLSVCFSRDYADLRAAVRTAGMGISASSYDNIPDYLFKAGKPDSTNTNRANSQRCTILNLGGPDPMLREASPLLSWLTAERPTLLSTVPTFRPFSNDDPSGQIPRPASDALADYMHDASDARPFRTFLSKIGKPVFSVGGVARNYIGIRDYEAAGAGCIPIKTHSEEERGLVLQILSSKLFYDYWRTYGDGFHVTVDLIERFPVTDTLARRLESNVNLARQVWACRGSFAKEKLNSGRVIRSYDFRAAFEKA
ncbi:hypothetical protein PSQ19_02550 [Devosia algicola]|uniref:DNA methylase adenine-specific domain-containing protein n=1 Tax=Devosia algicola TaxID=3026418 RepID=A0ABY7YPI7_9HYPH|nr:hypothetical protein [Devosia algicola]WDR03102.1 hypothetical protein PSQ19_02550 [Devosia algicola]